MIIKKIVAQSWLDQIPNEVKLKVKSIGRNPAGETENYWKLRSDNEVFEILEGELKIDGFPELKVVDFSLRLDSGYKGLLTKVTIINCPKLENINLKNNKISELDVSGLDNLIYLLASNNELGKVKVKGCVNLQWVLTFNVEKTRQEWEGLEDLKSLENINSGFPFFPVQKLKNWEKINEVLSGISNTDGTINEDELEEYKNSKGKPTQEQLTQAQNLIKDLKNEKTQLTTQRDNFQTQLTTANDLIVSTQNKLNVTNLNNLTQLPSGETPTTLLQRPTQEDYDKLKILKDTTVANYNKLVLEKNTLQQQLTATQAELAKVQADLAKWNSKFLNQTPEQVEAEIKKLKQSAAVITPEQQHKINDYNRLKNEKEVVERRRNAALDGLRGYITRAEYNAFVEANNKIN